MNEDEGGFGAVLVSGQEFVVDFQVAELCEMRGGFIQHIGRIGVRELDQDEERENESKTNHALSVAIFGQEAIIGFH